MGKPVGKIIKTEMIAAPDWMIYDNRDELFDIERQQLMAMAMEQKFTNAIKTGDVTKLYEIVFHFLNINALRADRKLYDEHYREIRDNKYLTDFVKNLGSETDGDAAQIINKINGVYTRILSGYLKFVIEMMGGVGMVYFDTRNIHYSNVEAYVLFNIKPHDNHELWKIEFKTENKLGSEMKCLGHFTMAKGNISEFKEFVQAYNRKRPVSRIRSGNFAAAVCDSAKDSKSVVSIIKDIIMLNKVFYDKDQFNPRVLIDINQILVDKNTFPFKLLMQ